MGVKESNDRGVHARYVHAWVKENFGAEGVQKVSSRLSSLASQMFTKPVPHGWYPTKLLKEVFEAVDKEFSPEYPDALRDVGKAIAERSISGFLQYFVKLISVKTAISRSDAIWKRYHDAGRIEIKMLSEEKGFYKAAFIVRDFDAGASWCSAHKGYLEGFLPYTNAKNVTVTKDKCIHKGDEYCSWIATWEE
ncbi:hypothetical protein GX441_01930 [bacterium]|nr:hypothetical protein [bacterium]